MVDEESDEEENMYNGGMPDMSAFQNMGMGMDAGDDDETSMDNFENFKDEENEEIKTSE